MHMQGPRPFGPARLGKEGKPRAASDLNLNNADADEVFKEEYSEIKFPRVSWRLALCLHWGLGWGGGLAWACLGANLPFVSCFMALWIADLLSPVCVSDI